MEEGPQTPDPVLKEGSVSLFLCLSLSLAVFLSAFSHLFLSPSLSSFSLLSFSFYLSPPFSLLTLFSFFFLFSLFPPSLPSPEDHSLTQKLKTGLSFPLWFVLPLPTNLYFCGAVHVPECMCMHQKSGLLRWIVDFPGGHVCVYGKGW